MEDLEEDPDDTESVHGFDIDIEFEDDLEKRIAKEEDPGENSPPEDETQEDEEEDEREDAGSNILGSPSVHPVIS
jgi:hypothetical protein